jgi:hypothetical protein
MTMPKILVRFRFSALRSLLVAAAGVSLLLATVTACSEPDGGGSDGGMVEDTGLDISYGEGSWEECCKEGEVSTCYCPGGVDCGYGEFTQCGGGRCVVPPMTCSGDAGDVGDTSNMADAGDSGPTDTGGDSGPTDTGSVDTAPDDTGAPDTSPADTHPADTNPADTESADTAPRGDVDAADIVETEL